MNIALVLSGGIGSRMKMKGFPKQYILVKEKPILIHTLEKFEHCDDIDLIIIVAAAEWQSDILRWANTFSISKLASFAFPGEQRQESILNGLNECLRYCSSENDVVIIHDAVRPLVSEGLISNCITSAREFGGCMPVIPIKDTVYQSVDGSNISNLLDRNTLYAGQAPEAFRAMEYARLNKAVTKEELNAYKGTSEIAYKYGMDVKLIPGEDSNYKITTPEDLNRFISSIEKSIE